MRGSFHYASTLALMATGTSFEGILHDITSDVEFEHNLNSHLNQLIIAFFYTKSSQTCENIRPDILSLAGKILNILFHRLTRDLNSWGSVCIRD